MLNQETEQNLIFTKTISINAPTELVWRALTDPQLMKQWMSETEIEIITDWQVGKPITIRAPIYKKSFEALGKVLSFKPMEELVYTHLASISRLPDVPENHSVLSFSLMPLEDITQVTLQLSNFPTEVIYKHLAFYWNVALEFLKRFIENK